MPSSEKHDERMASECTPSIFLTTAPVDTSISDAVLSSDVRHSVVPSSRKAPPYPRERRPGRVAHRRSG
eukprot:COSAG01_NODE_2695_length_7242_cov_4.051519_1_plen_68_part_10